MSILRAMSLAACHVLTSLVLTSLVLPSPSARAQSADVTVFAAASLKTALDTIAKDFEGVSGRKVAISYGASPALARQIEQGAPADLFISADTDWMDYLQARTLLKAGSRTNLLGNSIVLVAPLDGPDKVALEPGSLARTIGESRLSMATVAAVPAGRYGKAALERLGLWGEVSARVAEAENVRAALAFVARGEAPLGIVYRTDAAAEPRVKIVARFPAETHPPIIYPVAVLASAKGPGTEAFRAHLSGPASTRAFVREGFDILMPAATH